MVYGRRDDTNNRDRVKISDRIQVFITWTIVAADKPQLNVSSGFLLSSVSLKNLQETIIGGRPPQSNAYFYFNLVFLIIHLTFVNNIRLLVSQPSLLLPSLYGTPPLPRPKFGDETKGKKYRETGWKGGADNRKKQSINPPPVAQSWSLLQNQFTNAFLGLFCDFCVLKGRD